jgi:hypothetical protein
MSTAGKKYCRVSQTWLDAEEYDRRYANYDEMVFQRQPSQGQLCAPRIITDGMKPIQSMTNGQMYDSKSALRKEYKRANVIEVGNDVQMKKDEPSISEKQLAKERRKGSVARALSKAGFGAP